MLKLTVLMLGCMAGMMLACGKKDTPADPGQGSGSGSKYQATQDFHLVRQFKRVVQYDCAGAVVSDGIETVGSPTAWATIHPKNNIPIEASSIKNTRNGATPGAIFDHKTIIIDFSLGALNLHVEEGQNIIEYSYSNCGVRTADGQCQRWDLQEKGTTTFNVTYEEKHLDGVTENRPSNCK